MAKNRKYENVYQVTLSGNCTNGFLAKVRHGLLTGFVRALAYERPGHIASIEVLSTKGDFDALTEEVKED